MFFIARTVEAVYKGIVASFDFFHLPVAFQCRVLLVRSRAHEICQRFHLPRSVGFEFDIEKANIRVWGQEALADTTPVGSYPSGKSPFGLMDAAGNVFEWTSDLDPEQLKKGVEVVVLKGGSWKSYDSYARCAFRQFGEAAGFGPHIGFRCAKSP